MLFGSSVAMCSGRKEDQKMRSDGFEISEEMLKVTINRYRCGKSCIFAK